MMVLVLHDLLNTMDCDMNCRLTLAPKVLF